MPPSQEEVRRASGQPDTTSRRWLLKGGIHNIPLQLFWRSCTGVQPSILESAVESSKSPDNWLNSAWSGLRLWGRNEADMPGIPNFNGIIQRAIDLRDLKKDNGHFRHPMHLNPEDKRRLSCPLRPPHTRDIVGDNLISRIENLHALEPELLSDALGLFVVHLENRAFVRFESIERLSNADRYIQLLRRIGLGKRQIELVSGDPDPGSQHRRDWRDGLDESNMLLRPCDNFRNFVAKSSLSIRPNFAAANKVIGTGPAGFRFAMQMAFIVFGRQKDGLLIR
jgi:hypothetical protein